MTAQVRMTPAIHLLLVASLPTTAAAQIVRQRDALGHEVERHCQGAEWPKRLPAPDAVLDYGTLLAAVDALPESDTTSILFSILYREDGAATVRLLEPDTLPLQLGAPLLALLSSGLRHVKPPSAFGAVRLRLRGGRAGNGVVERALYCPPEPTPGGEIIPQKLAVQLRPGDRRPAPGSGRVQIEAELSIDETGHVTDARIITSSRIQELDESFVRQQFGRQFFPALIDGLPIASWVRTGGTRMRL